MRKLVLISSILITLYGCATDPATPESESLFPDIEELDSYRKSISARCSSSSHQPSPGNSSGDNSTGLTEASEKLLTKGYGTGSLDIGVTLLEKAELAATLGGLTNDQVENFIIKYQNCMNLEMTDFYQANGLNYPEKPETESILWGKQVSTVTQTSIAYGNGISGHWRHFEACVTIPDNTLMIKNSVKTSVVFIKDSEVRGSWRNDINFSNNNAYGPTKACRSFDHQLPDQNRLLKINVGYKTPES